jgi:hypothetical protein
MMHYPVHDALDGVRPAADLTCREREAHAALKATIECVAEPVLAAPVPEISAHVMARVAAMQRQPSFARRAAAAGRDALDWLWRPRPLSLSLRPAYALGALAVLLAVPMLTPSGVTPSALPTPHVDAGAPTERPVYVQFRIEAMGASRVALAGSFTDWRPDHEMHQSAPGTWSILLPLPPGVHDYAFIVDGETWLADPHSHQVDDGFGGSNSRLALPALSGTSI